jgi:CHAT domain-containing protein
VTAAELATFDVGADLVVLSACETALGKDVAGEGLFGLPYALAVAGARATLLTLWPVADRPTAEFMRRFYAKLARGVAPAAALAQTKREFIRSKEFSAPFYWAPFVLYGT